MSLFKQLLIFFGLATIMISIVLYSVYSAVKQRERYSKSLNLNFSGLVVSLDTVESRTVIASLELSYSDHENYDVRDSSKIYCCVIKGNRAEVILHPYDVRIGDSIIWEGNGFYLLHSKDFSERNVRKRYDIHNNIGKGYANARKRHQL